MTCRMGLLWVLAECLMSVTPAFMVASTNRFLVSSWRLYVKSRLMISGMRTAGICGVHNCRKWGKKSCYSSSRLGSFAATMNLLVTVIQCSSWVRLSTNKRMTDSRFSLECEVTKWLKSQDWMDGRNWAKGGNVCKSWVATSWIDEDWACVRT